MEASRLGSDASRWIIQRRPDTLINRLSASRMPVCFLCPVRIWRKVSLDYLTNGKKTRKKTKTYHFRSAPESDLRIPRSGDWERCFQWRQFGARESSPMELQYEKNQHFKCKTNLCIRNWFKSEYDYVFEYSNRTKYLLIKSRFVNYF